MTNKEQYSIWNHKNQKWIFTNKIINPLLPPDIKEKYQTGSGTLCGPIFLSQNDSKKWLEWLLINRLINNSNDIYSIQKNDTLENLKKKLKVIIDKKYGIWNLDSNMWVEWGSIIDMPLYDWFTDKYNINSDWDNLFVSREDVWKCWYWLIEELYDDETYLILEKDKVKNIKNKLQYLKNQKRQNHANKYL